jgi:hypothetical protein
MIELIDVVPCPSGSPDGLDLAELWLRVLAGDTNCALVLLNSLDPLSLAELLPPQLPIEAQLAFMPHLPELLDALGTDAAAALPPTLIGDLFKLWERTNGSGSAVFARVTGSMAAIAILGYAKDPGFAAVFGLLDLSWAELRQIRAIRRFRLTRRDVGSKNWRLLHAPPIDLGHQRRAHGEVGIALALRSVLAAFLAETGEAPPAHEEAVTPGGGPPKGGAEGKGMPDGSAREPVDLTEFFATPPRCNWTPITDLAGCQDLGPLPPPLDDAEPWPS